MSLSISPLSPLLQFLALSSVALILCVLIPFTKVEESFAIQAIHDFVFLAQPNNLLRSQHVLNSTRRWDHQDFPGLSPNTP